MEQYSVLQTVYKSDDPAAFETSLESMLKQTVQPDEVVLVKDGPVPESLQNVIDRLDQSYPGIIVQVQLPTNVGLGLALNEGLKVCKNELIARMDSDDISLPERCEKQLLMFENDPQLDIVGCPVKEFKDDPNHIVGVRDVPLENEAIHRYARRRDPFNHPTVMYRRSKVMQCGPYGDFRKNQDSALWLNMLSKGCKGANCPEYLLLFRFDEGTYRKRKAWINTKSLIQIRWDSCRRGFSSFWDFLIVAVAQMGIFILPTFVQKFVYTKILRRSYGD